MHSATHEAVPPIRGVIFDIHATLVDQGHPTAWVDAALARAPHEIDPLQRSALEAFLDRIWEGARISDPESTRDLSFAQHEQVFHDLLAAGPGVDPSLGAALYAVMLDVWHAYADAAPTLKVLRDAGVRICLLSNAGVPIRRVLDREGLSHLVDEVVLSYEVGYVKPDTRIFQAALDAIDCSAHETLMVGDSGRDDSGGAALGIRTLILPRTTGPVHGLGAVLALTGHAESNAPASR
jgi:HAD superfamily hydrolase (TIGR01509 family)